MSALLNPEDRPVWRSVNSAPFSFRHSLAKHPLLETSRLIRLAERFADRGLKSNYFFPGSDRVKTIPELKLRLAEAIAEMDSDNGWFKLGDIHEVDADYKNLMHELLAEIQDLAQSEVFYTPDTGLSIFMNSPRAAVPYHFDHESNFLMQVRGVKEVSLFPNDELVVTPREREDYYRGNPMAGRWRDELKKLGRCFRISPGRGVHHPPLAPHAIQNGDSCSLSLSVYYTSPVLDARGRVYRANYHLRKLGFRPRDPGISPVTDRIKDYGIAGAVTMLRPVRRIARKVMNSS